MRNKVGDNWLSAVVGQAALIVQVCVCVCVCVHEREVAICWLIDDRRAARRPLEIIRSAGPVKSGKQNVFQSQCCSTDHSSICPFAK